MAVIPKVCFEFLVWNPTAVSSQTVDIVDMAIHPVVCQKSNFRRKSDIQKSETLYKYQQKNQTKAC